MAKVDAVKITLHMLLSIIQIAVTVNTGSKKSRKKKPSFHKDLERYHRYLAESFAEATRQAVRELRAQQLHVNRALEANQELLEFRHFKEPFDQTAAWLYCRTLAPAVEPFPDAYREQRTGYAKTVATQRGDDVASESEMGDEDGMPQAHSDFYTNEIPERISDDVADELYLTKNLGHKVVDELLGTWTTLSEHQILENGKSSEAQKVEGYQKTIDKVIGACLKEDHSLGQSWHHSTVDTIDGEGAAIGSERKEVDKSNNRSKRIALPELDGCVVQPSGEIHDDKSLVIGRLTEGDAKRLSKKRAKCDREGNVVLHSKVVGKVTATKKNRQQAPFPKTSLPPAPEVSEIAPPTSSSALQERNLTIEEDESPPAPLLVNNESHAAANDVTFNQENIRNSISGEKHTVVDLASHPTQDSNLPNGKTESQDYQRPLGKFPSLLSAKDKPFSSFNFDFGARPADLSSNEKNCENERSENILPALGKSTPTFEETILHEDSRVEGAEGTLPDQTATEQPYGGTKEEDRAGPDLKNLGKISKGILSLSNIDEQELERKTFTATKPNQQVSSAHAMEPINEPTGAKAPKSMMEPIKTSEKADANPAAAGTKPKSVSFNGRPDWRDFPPVPYGFDAATHMPPKSAGQTSHVLGPHTDASPSDSSSMDRSSSDKSEQQATLNQNQNPRPHSMNSASNTRSEKKSSAYRSSTRAIPAPSSVEPSVSMRKTASNYGSDSDLRPSYAGDNNSFGFNPYNAMMPYQAYGGYPPQQDYYSYPPSQYNDTSRTISKASASSDAKLLQLEEMLRGQEQRMRL
ncbi:hypothetical protein EJ08DRAFT_189124 [Tothia fuscella]|uniref:Uncharacterized protein n=1 Tax=Tothia fuscella TaxID=1048955 RepID=A0A9P4NU89_9PEZI|nr:hypothetical protein EJ08DRAFT_189124 [Tothia fuscella]